MTRAAVWMVALGLLTTVCSATAAPVPGTQCGVLPRNNIWNTDISTMPVHDRSDDWLETMDSADTLLHPDFGRRPWGFPFAVVANDHPTVTVRFRWPRESDRVPYPLGPDTPLEGGSDRHALMVNEDTCVLYELYAVDWNDGEPKAGSGAVFDLGSNALRPDTWTSADAAGLPIFPGLVRYDEVRAGAINHAIRVTAEYTDSSHLWPARHDAGEDSGQVYPPMGARFRLQSDYDLSGFSRDARVILVAMQRYGLMMADNGSNWYFSGAQDRRWTDDLLDELKSVPASEFEAVDVSSLMINPNSGRARRP